MKTPFNAATLHANDTHHIGHLHDSADRTAIIDLKCRILAEISLCEQDGYPNTIESVNNIDIIYSGLGRFYDLIEVNEAYLLNATDLEALRYIYARLCTL